MNKRHGPEVVDLSSIHCILHTFGGKLNLKTLMEWMGPGTEDNMTEEEVKAKLVVLKKEAEDEGW